MDKTDGYITADKKPVAVWRKPFIVGIISCLIVLVAGLIWFPPFWQLGYAPADSRPFLEESAWEDRLDINCATVPELMLLPGIGEKRAEAIVAYREINGPYTSKEQLLNVQGIGPKIADDIANLVVFGQDQKDVAG